MSEWYQIADIGVLPSYAEQCSYVGIEMMMYGLPIVASDGFGLSSMFKDRVNGIVVKIGNTEDENIFVENLTESILELLSSKGLQNK